MSDHMFLSVFAVLGAAVGGTLAASEIRQDVEIERTWVLRAACGSVTAALFVTLAAVIGPEPQVLVHLYLAAMAVPLAVIDLRTMRLPRRLTLPMYPATVLLVSLTSAPHGEVVLARPIAGMAVYLAFHLALALTHGGLGGGDVLLAGPLGLVLACHGWSTLLAGAVLTGFFGLLTIAWERLRRGGTPQEIPYGPAMLAGTLTAAITG